MYFYPGGERCVVAGSDAACEPRSMFGTEGRGVRKGPTPSAMADTRICLLYTSDAADE